MPTDAFVTPCKHVSYSISFALFWLVTTPFAIISCPLILHESSKQYRQRCLSLSLFAFLWCLAKYSISQMNTIWHTIADILSVYNLIIFANNVKYIKAHLIIVVGKTVKHQKSECFLETYLDKIAAEYSKTWTISILHYSKGFFFTLLLIRISDNNNTDHTFMQTIAG